jgi:threonine/homoserine/homoserine lactone efflux protein
VGRGRVPPLAGVEDRGVGRRHRRAAATFLGAGAGGALAQAAALAALFVLAAMPSGFVWLAFGAVVERGLRHGRRRRVFDVALGALLALAVALILR